MARIEDLRLDDEPRTDGGKARRRRPWLMIAAGVVIVTLAVVLWPGAASGPDPGATPVVAAPPTAAGPAVPAGGAFTAGGYVEVITPGPTVVAARVAGPIASVDVIEGAAVQAGTVLATIDDTVPRQNLAEAAADLALARAHLARLQAGFRPEEIAEAEARADETLARAEFARGEVQRQQQLVQIGAAPERQLLAARSDLAAAEAELVAAEAQLALRRAGTRREDLAVAGAAVAQAEARHARLAWQVEQCVVRAPVAGVVLERFVRVGDHVAPGQDGDRQGAVLTLFDPERLQVWVDVNQRDAERVRPGQRVELRADAWRGRSVPGRVDRVMPRANLQRNTVEVKIAIERGDAATDGEQPWLRPEMSVQVTFLDDDQSFSSQQPEGDVR